MQDLPKLLKLIVHSPIDFVLVGGFAAVLHGSNQTTRDIDICIVFKPETIGLLRNLLSPLNPRYRMGELEGSFLEEPKDLSKKVDLHLMTDLGPLDVISRVEGVGDYYDVLKNSDEIELYEGRCRLICLDDLIRSKKKLGRHRDLITAMELEAIRHERGK